MNDRPYKNYVKGFADGIMVCQKCITCFSTIEGHIRGKDLLESGTMSFIDASENEQLVDKKFIFADEHCYNFYRLYFAHEMVHGSIWEEHFPNEHIYRTIAHSVFIYWQMMGIKEGLTMEQFGMKINY